MRNNYPKLHNMTQALSLSVSIAFKGTNFISFITVTFTTSQCSCNLKHVCATFERKCLNTVSHVLLIKLTRLCKKTPCIALLLYRQIKVYRSIHFFLKSLIVCLFYFLLNIHCKQLRS